MRNAEKPIILHTKHLALHPFDQEDERAMAEMLLDGEIAQTYMIPEFSSMDAVKALFARFRQLSLEPGRLVYGIYLGKQLIGFANEVHRTEDTMELGYVIHPAHKGRGYATEALQSLIRAVFSMGFTTVKAGAFEENRASLRVMEKCGMVPTGETEEISYRGKNHRCIYCSIQNN